MNDKGAAFVTEIIASDKTLNKFLIRNVYFPPLSSIELKMDSKSFHTIFALIPFRTLNADANILFSLEPRHLFIGQCFPL